jgi:hypothetical protein
LQDASPLAWEMLHAYLVKQNRCVGEL